MNIVKGNEYFNIRYQIKPFMSLDLDFNFIISHSIRWITVYLEKHMKNKILLSIIIFF